MIGFTIRRLSWPEICLVCLLMQQVVPFARPYLTPALLTTRNTVFDYMLAVKQNSVASLRAAVATFLAAMASTISNRSTLHAQELRDHRAMIAAELVVLKDRLALAQAAASATTPVVTSTPTVVPEVKTVMPVGNIGSAVLTIELQGGDTALCDDGATIDCFLTTDGVIPGTHDSSQGGALTVGDKKSSLASKGVYLYAIERCGANHHW